MNEHDDMDDGIGSRAGDSLAHLPPPGRGDVPQEVLALWNRYAVARTEEMRNHLIEYYMPLAYQTAEKMARNLPQNVDTGDLIMAASLGLIDAIEKFEPERGNKFETYCCIRMHGAIIDDLRRMDPVPRQIRYQLHQLSRAREEMEIQLGHEPSNEELADYMKLTHEQFDHLLSEVNIKAMFSLDQKRDRDDDHELGPMDTLADTRTESPIDELQRNEIKELAIRGLSAMERQILIMKYYDNLSLAEIGAVLDISESRVCQIHQQILGLLRQKFSAREITHL